MGQERLRELRCTDLLCQHTGRCVLLGVKETVIG